jgi:hypothetical protein
MGLKPSNAEASGTTVGRKLSKKNLMGFHSAGTPTKQGSKLGILEHTYTKAMPYTHTQRPLRKKLIELQLNLQQPKLTSYMMIVQKGGKERTREINNRKYSPRNEAMKSQFS